MSDYSRTAVLLRNFNGQSSSLNLYYTSIQWTQYTPIAFYCKIALIKASEAKLLGVHTDSNLSWHTHVDTIVSKATQWLYFLKQLKRAGVPRAQLLHFYISVIRPVLEYAVPVCQHLLTKTQTDSIESVQKRALRIIYSFSNDTPHCNSRCRRYCQLIHLKKRTLVNFFIPWLTLPSLFTLYSPPPDPDLLARLRAPTKFPRIPTRTKKNISRSYHTPFPVIKHRFYLHFYY